MWIWPDIHMTPQEGMRAHLDLQGGRPHGVMLPIHWGTFNLAPHPWSEPGEGTLAAARDEGAGIALPIPGEPFEPGSDAVPGVPWWRGVAVVPDGGWADVDEADAGPRAATSGEPEAAPVG